MFPSHGFYLSRHLKIIIIDYIKEGKKEGCLELCEWGGEWGVYQHAQGGKRLQEAGRRPEQGDAEVGWGGRGDDSEINNKIKTFVEQSEAMQQQKNDMQMVRFVNNMAAQREEIT